ncbi:hypothetical protein K0M31_015327 [Melipona bicolor]|uniref:Carboxylesterase type B domain-containing protein n=1 Tax=Melipona bicolor TaxID=60889 RepID=A0AA40FGY3_9HYME|nr:hypothetical protein K0M31_015327 [Melipona bicolor]
MNQQQNPQFPTEYAQLTKLCFTIQKKKETISIVLQYTDWEDAYNGYIYQKMVADVVGDYFFICPSIHFAQLFADRGMKVYYYFFTQVGTAFLSSRAPGRHVKRRPIDEGNIML